MTKPRYRSRNRSNSRHSESTMIADRSRRQGVLRGMLVLSVCTLLAGSSQAATLTWNPSADTSVIGYVVYIGTASGEYSSTVDVGSETSYQFTPADPPTIYYL